MDYSRWQALHKRAWNGEFKKPSRILTAQEISDKAWVRLTRYCQPHELEKLVRLARQYQEGAILS